MSKQKMCHFGHVSFRENGDDLQATVEGARIGCLVVQNFCSYSDELTATENQMLASSYQAAMVLSGVGDAMGYRNGRWEFCYDGGDIHKELVKKFGGLAKLKIMLPGWPVSDDTVLHIATAEALATNKPVGEELFLELVKCYMKGNEDMGGRAPGPTTQAAIFRLKTTQPEGYVIPFNDRGGGCGAAMRSMCIGLRYHQPEQLSDLVAVAVESGRMTHNHPTGHLGSLASALFTSYAVQGKPVREWGAGLMATLPKAMDYIKSLGRDVIENKIKWNYFEAQWKNYLKLRGLTDGNSDPKFPEEYGIKERDEFYKSVSYNGWGGASGHDAPMIAYDAVLGAGDSWEELCLRGVLHGGDNDSTGAIACCWWGVMYGMEEVPKNHYKDLEYRSRLEELGEKLYNLSHPQ